MTTDGMDTGAIFSPDRVYRYVLWRRWDVSLPTCAFIGLNPSTADETEDDPTIRRCIRFAKDWGYGCMQMLNIFAFRATDPSDMKLAHDPVGPLNDEYILAVTRMSGRTVAAWGAHGTYGDRQRDVLHLLAECRVHCLGVTKRGCPRHPLYLKASTEPVPWLR